MSANILASTENLSYADWLEHRRLGIGGSDASVVCGINKYKSPVELWMDEAHNTLLLAEKYMGKLGTEFFWRLNCS